MALTKIRQSNLTQPLDENLSVPSITSSGNISLADSAKAIFGDGNDLQIYHDSQHSRIVDNGTGNLIIQGTNLDLADTATGDTFLRAVSDGSVEIYYDGSKKFETTNTGISVTGDVVISGDLTVSGNTVTLNASTLDVEDLNITLASGATDANTANGAGITIDGASATLTYDADDDGMVFNKNVGIGTQAGMGPDTPLTIVEYPSATAVIPQIKLAVNTSNNTPGATGSSIDFVASGDMTAIGARIIGTRAAAGAHMDLRFHTRRDAFAMIIDASQNVGIGTDTPNALLDLAGVTASSSPVLRFTGTGNASAGDVIGQIEFYNSDATDYTPGIMGAIRAIAGPSGGEGSLQFLVDMPSEGADAATVALHLNSNGNVGIGTDAPNSKLEVATSDNVNSYSDGAIQVVSSSPIAFVAPSNLNPSLNRWGFKLRENSEGDFSIHDYRQSLTRLLIDGSGNVGIGTIDPQSTLDVRSTSTLGSVFRKFFNGSVANTASKVAVTVWGEDHDEADAGAGTSQYGPMLGFGARIDSGSPNTGDVRAGISYSYNGDLTFHAKAGASVADGSYERIRIDGATGSVGVNHDTPSKMLSVNVSSDTDGIYLYSNKTQIGSLSRTTVDSNVVTSLDGNTGRDIYIGGTINTDVILGYAGGNVGIGTTSLPTHLLEVVKNDATLFDPDDIPTDGSGASILINNTNTANGPSYSGINLHAYGASTNITRGFLGIVNDENPYSGGWSGTDGHLSFGIRGRNFGAVIERVKIDSEGKFIVKSKDGEGSIHSEQVRHNIRPSFIADFANSKELDSRFKFYRTTSSGATYYDKTGTIRYAVENEPRFDHDPVTGECLGLLVEDPHTNLLEDASRGTFGWSHDAVITKDNAAEAPDGTFDAFLLQPTTSDGKISAGGTTSGAGTYTGSVWLKSATTDGSNVSMDIALYDVNTFYTNSITVTNEWQRFEVTFTSTNASTSYPRFYIGGASSMAKGEDLYVWGAQLQTGDHASSYIPATEQFQARAGVTGDATYYDYEGKLTTAAGNQERYGYKHNGRRWIPTGLIRESEAANLWNYSEDTYSYNWIKSGVTVSKRGAVLGPDGQYSAQRITAGAGSSYHYMYRSSVVALTSGRWYTVSFFVKPGTENRIATYHSDGSTTRQFIFNMSTKEFEYVNADYYGYEDAYDGWMRLWYTFQATTNVSPNMHFFMRTTGQYTTSGGEYFDFFGFQLEEELNNNQNAGPTSYIKTEASSVTRGADSVDCEYSSHGADHAYITDLDWYNEEAGTLYYEASANHTSGDTGGGRLGFSYDEDNNNRIMANINSTSYALFIQSDGTTYLNMSNTAPPSVGAMHKRAWAATTGDAAAYINGDQIGTGVNIVMPKVNMFKLSNPTTDGDYIDGHFKKIAYYPERLSNATLKALTEND